MPEQETISVVIPLQKMTLIELVPMLLIMQPQPRISELLHGKISRMNIDKLVDYLHRLGAKTKVEVSVKKIETQKAGGVNANEHEIHKEED